MVQKGLSIGELWVAHSQRPFPKGYGGVDVNGVCVTSVATYASGCISTYVQKTEYNIDLERYQVLQRCKRELAMFLPSLNNEAYEYFNELKIMIDMVLTEAKIT